MDSDESSTEVSGGFGVGKSFFILSQEVIQPPPLLGHNAGHIRCDVGFCPEGP